MPKQREGGISWTDETWNPIRGCSRVSHGCEHCYAEKVAHRFSGPGQPYEGLAHKVNGHAAWTGKVMLAEGHLLDPLKWKPVRMECSSCLSDHTLLNCPEKLSRSRRIFVNSMSDLFHESVPDEWIDRIFAVMALCPQHTFQVLTKRPERMLAYLSGKDAQDRIASKGGAFQMESAIPLEKYADRSHFRDVDGVMRSVFARWPLANVQLGVSVEDQKTADERISLLLQTPAAVRFISAEPLLGGIDLGVLLGSQRWPHRDGPPQPDDYEKAICWVICGGESGTNARPMHPDWARSLRDQCQSAGVPFFFKQWGEWTHQISAYSSLEPKVYMNIEGNCVTEQRALAAGGSWKGMYRVGKKAAGSLLDGAEWKQFPEVQR